MFNALILGIRKDPTLLLLAGLDAWAVLYAIRHVGGQTMNYFRVRKVMRDIAKSEDWYRGAVK